MSLDDVRDDWRAQEDDELLRVSPEELVRYVKSEARRFDRRIRFRDWRENIAAVVAVAVLAPGALSGNAVTRLGLAALAGAFLFMAVTLRKARGARSPAHFDRSVSDVLLDERQRVEAQVRLLDNVTWWYITPISLATMIIVVGRVGLSGAALAVAGVFIVLAVVIRALNRHAVRKALRPRLDEMTRLLADVNRAEPSDTESSSPA